MDGKGSKDKELNEKWRQMRININRLAMLIMTMMIMIKVMIIQINAEKCKELNEK